MTQIRSSVPNFLGGLSTLPLTLRERTEVAEAENVLFSLADGAYRRPGTEIIHRFLNRPVPEFIGPGDAIPTHAALGITNQMVDVGNLIRYQRAMWAFPISGYQAQILLLGHGTWETLWIDLKTNSLLRNSQGQPIDSDRNPISPPYPSHFGRSQYLRFHTREGDPLTWAQVLDPQGPRPTPQQVFRVTKSEGKIWILNKTVPARMTTRRAAQNSNIIKDGLPTGYHKDHWMIIFYALSSGQDARIAMTFQADGVKHGQEFNLGSDGVETIAERFVVEWMANPENTDAKLLPADFQTKPPDAVRARFDVRARGQTASVRVLDDSISDLEFRFLNVAGRPVSDNAGDTALAGLPTVESLPATAPRDWIVEVQGSSTSRIDNAWYRFKVGGET